MNTTTPPPRHPTTYGPTRAWASDTLPLRVQAPAHHPGRQPRAGRLVDPSMDRSPGTAGTAGNVGQGYQGPRAPHPHHVATAVERWFYRSGWRVGVGHGLVGGGLLGFLAAMAFMALGRMVG